MRELALGLALVALSVTAVQAQPDAQDAFAAPFVREEIDIKKKAFVAGVRNYTHLTKVQSAEKDAADVAKKLRAIGFEVNDAIDEDSLEMWDRFKRFSSALTPEDMALFYFSGHGFQYEGLSYLVPKEVPPKVDYDDLSLTTLPLDSVVGWLERRKPSFILLIIDACREITANIATRQEGWKSIGSGMADIRTPPPQLIFGLATYFGKVAFSSTQATENSVYTKHLLANIDRPGAEIYTILQSVGGGVFRDQANQRPEIRSVVAGSFFPNPTEETHARARQTWESVRQTSTKDTAPTQVEDFLYYWPVSRHTRAARRWLEVQRAAPTQPITQALTEIVATQPWIAFVPYGAGGAKQQLTWEKVAEVRGRSIAYPVIRRAQSNVVHALEKAQAAEEIELFETPDLPTTAVGKLYPGDTFTVVSTHTTYGLPGIDAGGWTKLKLNEDPYNVFYMKDAVSVNEDKLSLTMLLNVEFAPTSNKHLSQNFVPLASVRIEQQGAARVESRTLAGQDLSELRGAIGVRGTSINFAKATASVEIANFAEPGASAKERGQMLFLKALQIRQKLEKLGVLSANMTIKLPPDDAPYVSGGPQPYTSRGPQAQRDRLLLAVR